MPISNLPDTARFSLIQEDFHNSPQFRPVRAILPKCLSGGESFTLRKGFGHRLTLLSLIKQNETLTGEVGMVGSVAEAPQISSPSPTVLITEQTDPSLSPTDRDHLGERLRAMYNALRDEPLPQHLQDLIGRFAHTPSE